MGTYNPRTWKGEAGEAGVEGGGAILGCISQELISKYKTKQTELREKWETETGGKKKGFDSGNATYISYAYLNK